MICCLTSIVSSSFLSGVISLWRLSSLLSLVGSWLLGGLAFWVGIGSYGVVEGLRHLAIDILLGFCIRHIIALHTAIVLA